MARDRDRWNERYRTGDAPGEISSFLRSVAHLLPRSGRALDVAGGSGANACWLAGLGLEVTLVDVSDVAVEMARSRAKREGVEIRALATDLTVDALPDGPWELVICLHYLQRDLFPLLSEALCPGGVLVMALATRRNLERHARPPAPYLLEEGEAPSLVPDLEVLLYEEGWGETSRHDARLVARKPPPPEGPG